MQTLKIKKLSKSSMANSISLSAKISFIFFLTLCPYLSLAISSCNGRCETFDDCSGQLTCIHGRCNDDPAAGSRVCSGGRSRRSRRPSPANGFCTPTGTLQCDGESEPQPTFDCSPPVTSSTKALLTNNDFSKGGDGGGASECDGAFHDNSERVVALSTGWFNGGSLCGKTIRIRAENGRTTTAKVVDECDSLHGCDDEHDGQPPCRHNIVDGSNAVWDALGLNIDVGVESVTWSVA